MKSFLKKSALCSASCLQALSVVGMAAGAVAISAPAVAQDYTSGAISGTVTDDAGAPVAGATVTATSTSQGFSRTTTSGAAGTFRFASLPTGTYTLEVEAPGMAGFTATDVQVLAGDTATLAIAMSGAGGSEIVVTAASILAPFSGTTSGVNVDVAELVKQVPLGRSITNVILLAPATSKGDSAFGNLASIGGSSVAENAYYINGLNITNFDNYLGSVEVPFDFYRSVEVKSGGYPAEFGRATGGVINAVSKAGSNDFMAAAHLNWAPDFLRSDASDIETCDTSGACENATNRSQDTSEAYSAIVEASGPIIKDRLFVYGLLEMQRTKTRTISRSSGLAYDRTNTDPFWAVKVDAFPLDDHHLEFTIFDTRNTTTRRNLAYSENDDGTYNYGTAQSIQDYNFGGVNYVGKYTGHFTDWLTISAAYGRMRDRFDIAPVDAGSGAPYFSNASGDTVNGTPNGGLITGQITSLTDDPYNTERKFYRGDMDLFFSVLGDHHVRVGFDVEKNFLEHSSVRPGNSVLCPGFLSAEACAGAGGAAGAALILRANDQVEVNYYRAGGGFRAQNNAFYIQDEWDLTDRLTLNLGLRRDDYQLNNVYGEQFLESDENYAPRIGMTYDLWPDRSGRLTAFWGRYYMPFASNTAQRQASGEVYIRERYNYDGFDGNGLPVLTSKVLDYPGYSSACPIHLTNVGPATACAVTADGSVPTLEEAVAANLKATRETEWILGYEHKLNDWTVGLTYTHRQLDITAEDMAIDSGVINWCEDNGIEGCEATWTGFNQYVVANPGYDMVVNLHGLDNRQVTITAEQLGAYPKPKRKFDSVVFTFAHPWNGKWSLNGSYTWSQSKGNYEGFVQSDFGQDDAGITVDFDQPDFAEYSYGYLPNHRRHRFKLWGAYAITDAFTLGANASLESPRPLSCFGYYPDPNSLGNVYGSAYSHFCGGVPQPRGEAQKTEWVKQIDLSGRYKVEIPTGQEVTFRFDVFNIFDSHAVQYRNEVGDLSYDPPSGATDGNNPDYFTANPNYGLAQVYQSPRYVRLGIDIEF